MQVVISNTLLKTGVLEIDTRFGIAVWWLEISDHTLGKSTQKS